MVTRATLLLILLTCAIVWAADKKYYEFPDTTTVRDNSRILVYDTISGSRNITGATLRSLAGDTTGKLDKSTFNSYTSTARLTVARFLAYSSLGRGSVTVDISGKLDTVRFTNFSTNWGRYQTATETSYGATTVAAALDSLLYVSPSVSLSGGSSNEIGATISSVVLNWSVNKTITSQSLDNGIGAITPATVRTYTHSGQTITSNRTYQITVNDGTNNATSSTTVAFYARRHWGVSASTSLDSAAILALASNELSTSHSKSITYDCTGGRYPYFAYPASWGLLTAVTVGGLAFSDFSTDTVSHTNVSGYAQNYYVVRFNSLQTGSSIAVVWH